MKRSFYTLFLSLIITGIITCGDKLIVTPTTEVLIEHFTRSSEDQSFDINFMIKIGLFDDLAQQKISVDELDEKVNQVLHNAWPKIYETMSSTLKQENDPDLYDDLKESFEKECNLITPIIITLLQETSVQKTDAS